MSIADILANYDSSCDESRSAVLAGFSLLLEHLKAHEKARLDFEDTVTEPESVLRLAETLRLVRGLEAEDEGPPDPEELIGQERDDFAAIAGRRQQRRDEIAALHECFQAEAQPEEAVILAAASLFQNLLIRQAVEWNGFLKVEEVSPVAGVQNMQQTNLARQRFFVYLEAYNALAGAEAHAEFWYPFDDI